MGVGSLVCCKRHQSGSTIFYRNGDGNESPEVHPTIAKKLSLAGHLQRRVSTYAIVEVKRARVNRGGVRLVILVRLGAPRKHGVVVQPACLIYEFVCQACTAVSSDVRPISTNVGIRCFSGGALVASRSSRVHSARVIEPEP